MSLKNITFGDIEKFNVVVEISAGSQDKYEYDEHDDVIRLDRVLHGSYRYPFNYGFIPETRAADGDHTDVLLFSTNPLVVGSVVQARAIGFMSMIDSGEEDNKILAVPVKDPRFKSVTDLSDVEDHILKEIQNFFEIYKVLEGKTVSVGGFEDKAKAIVEIESTREVYTKERA